MLNLFDYLTELDNKRIENYIHTFGAVEDFYCGNEKYLKYWAKCKPHLFHLLGGNLIYKFPICIEKPKAEINLKLSRLIADSSFIDHFYNHIKEKEKLLEDLNCRFLCHATTFESDELPVTVKIKPEGYQKTLQLQKGMKPIRAISKLIDYFEWNDLKEEFEEFRIAHSMVLNDKMIKGNLCLSIHPLDFITMSDNNNGWTSCMSWVKAGCYHLGTVEMMNSNNVICCYVESAEDYNFGKEDSDESWHWNNKKWRQLFYVTKEIAVCGKAYPYQHKELSLLVLDKIKELSEKNLGKSYTFGPEPYRDMIHIGSNTRMENNKYWIRTKRTTKHNIIFDTKGMYNDMFNDHDLWGKDLYWCYRNKVKHNIIISCSGKAPCIKCGRPVLRETDALDSNYDGAYNDRYSGVDELLCEDCRREITCDFCGENTGRKKLFKFNGKQYCIDCVKKYLRKCPICGELFIAKTYDNQLYLRTTKDTIYQQDFYHTTEKDKLHPVEPLFVCFSCRDKIRKNFEKIKPPVDESITCLPWKRDLKYFVSKEVEDANSPEWSKFLFKNLALPKIE